MFKPKSNQPLLKYSHKLPLDISASAVTLLLEHSRGWQSFYAVILRARMEMSDLIMVNSAKEGTKFRGNSFSNMSLIMSVDPNKWQLAIIGILIFF